MGELKERLQKEQEMQEQEKLEEEKKQQEIKLRYLQEKEQKEKELREMKLRELKEREEQLRELKEKERKEKDQRDKKEQEQKENERKFREQQEKEKQEQMEKQLKEKEIKLKELKEKNNKLKEQKEKEEKENLMRIQQLKQLREKAEAHSNGKPDETNEVKNESEEEDIKDEDLQTDEKPVKESCTSDPNFAVICSFLDKFGGSVGIPCPTILELQNMLESDGEPSTELITFQVRLLRKLKKSVSMDKWEKALIKFCFTYSTEDGWELDRFGYKRSKLTLKVRIVKNLCEAQFDLNAKFKLEINKL